MANINELLAPPTASLPFTLSSTTSEPRRLVAGPKPIIIGRASKHENRGIQAKSDNAAFECPVVSREHAIIDTKWDERLGEHEITITDMSSLHGTFVNGVIITPHQPYTLCDGDIIELGANVARGNDTFKGVTVVFKISDEDTHDDGYGHYSVPSESEVDAETNYGDSSSEFAYYDDSANTSPESMKEQATVSKTAPVQPVRGSQDKPIDLESFHVGSLRPVLDITEDNTSSSARPFTQAPACEAKPTLFASLVAAEREKFERADQCLQEQTPGLGHGIVAEGQDQTIIEKSNVQEDHMEDSQWYDNHDDVDSDVSIELGEEPYGSHRKPKPWTAPPWETGVNTIKLPPISALPWQRPVAFPGATSSDKAAVTEKSDAVPEATVIKLPIIDVVVDPSLGERHDTADLVVKQRQYQLQLLHAEREVKSRALAASTTKKAEVMSKPVEEKADLVPAEVTEPWTVAPPQESVDEQPNTIEVPVGASAATSNKRKHEEDDIAIRELVDILMQDAETTRPKKKLKVVKKSTAVLRELGKYALGAAVGATGTFTLLASPLGGALVDWVTTL